jgi:hypothetical protein
MVITNTPKEINLVWIPARTEWPDENWPGEWQPNDLWYSETQLGVLCDFATLLDVIAPQSARNKKE